MSEAFPVRAGWSPLKLQEYLEQATILTQVLLFKNWLSVYLSLPALLPEEVGCLNPLCASSTKHCERSANALCQVLGFSSAKSASVAPVPPPH